MSLLWLVLAAPVFLSSVQGLLLDADLGLGLQLPNFHAQASSTASELSKLEAQNKWWVQVDDRIFHAPHEVDTPLSSDIGAYFCAIGSESALGDDLKSRRVGGSGRWHIFHVPEGVSLLQVTQEMGDRRSALSRLKNLNNGMVLSNSFPKYSANASYQHPLSDAGQKVEKSAVEGVNEKEYKAYLTQLTDLGTRSYTNKKKTKAALDIFESAFKSMGLKTCIHKFTGKEGSKLENVIALSAGEGAPLVVGAHYDSRPYDGPAPGAVDNGSGAAGLLMMAKILTDLKAKTEKPVTFIAFGGEEAGTLGSEAYVDAYQKDGLAEMCGFPEAGEKKDGGGSFLEHHSSHSGGNETIFPAAIIMDEIGWATKKMYDGRPTVNLESFDTSSYTLNHLAASSKMHNGDKLDVVHSNNPFGSDHMAFLGAGVPAVLTIMGDDEGYPDYHKSTDRIENVDFGYAVNILKMNVGAMIRMAGVSSK